VTSEAEGGAPLDSRAVGAPLARQAVIYTASQLVGRAIPFLLLPILTRYLSPAEFGIVAMFLLVALLLEPFVSVGFAGAVTVKFYDRAVDMASYLGTGVAVVAAVGLAAAAILFVVSAPLEAVTAVPLPWLVLAAPLVVSRAIWNGLLALLRVHERAVAFGVFQNLQSVGLLGLAVLFVVALRLGWQGRVGAELIAWAIFATAGLAWLVREGWLRFAFNAAYARHLARFGVPLIPHTLGAVLILQTDRFFLTNLVGVEQTGLYTVGYQLAVVVELIAVSFNNAYTPWLFRRLADINETVKRQLVRLTYLQFGVMAVLALLVAVFMPRVGALVLDQRYLESGTFVGWFALGFLFSGMYYMVANYIFFAERTGLLALVTITTALINIPVTYLLIRVNGAIGAAQGTAFALFLSFALTWLLSSRVYPMPWLGGRGGGA
jgi:O-antigen/teichoic acid export membrane protein